MPHQSSTYRKTRQSNPSAKSEAQRRYRQKRADERAKLKADALPVVSKRKLSKTFQIMEREAREIDGLILNLGKIETSTCLQVGELLGAAHEKLSKFGKKRK